MSITTNDVRKHMGLEQGQGQSQGVTLTAEGVERKGVEEEQGKVEEAE